MAKLILIRHAKSDWSKNVIDFKRGLSNKGYKSCKIILKELKKRIEKPNLFLVSPALRAQLTYQNIFEDWDISENNLSIEKDLYYGSLDEVKQNLSKKIFGFSTVAMIGHNPMFNGLIHDIPSEGHKLLPFNLVTCGVVIIEFPNKKFKPRPYENGKVIDYLYPRQFL